MLFVKFIVVILLLFVMASLFTSLVFLVKDKGKTNRTVNALTVRIVLSLVAIAFIVIASATGLLKTNVPPF